MTLQTVILAGGLGTRMRPRTETIPKALLPVAGKPFAEWQLDLLAQNGIRDVLYTVGHLGEQIEAHVGNGGRWGLSVRYSYEDAGLLGTGGAIRLASDRELLDGSFFILYGDSYLPISLAPVERAFRAADEPALMTVFNNDGRWGPNNAVFENGRVTLYDKNRGSQPSNMKFIDYGLSALTRRVVTDHIEQGKACDLADVLKQLSISGQLAGYEINTRFYEIGSPQGISCLEDFLRLAGGLRVLDRDLKARP